MDGSHAHRLPDQPDAGQFAAVSSFLEVMVDPVAHALAAAPLDDEEVTENDRRRIEEGKAWFAANKGIPREGVLADFGPVKSIRHALSENGIPFISAQTPATLHPLT